MKIEIMFRDRRSGWIMAGNERTLAILPEIGGKYDAGPDRDTPPNVQFDSRAELNRCLDKIMSMA